MKMKNKKGIFPLITVPLLLALALVLLIVFLGAGFVVTYVAPRAVGIFLAVIGLILIMNIAKLDKNLQKMALIISLVFIIIGALIAFVPQIGEIMNYKTLSIFG